MLNVPKRFIRIKKRVRVEEDDKWAELSPYNGFRINFRIDFSHPAISNNDQHLIFDFSSINFIKTGSIYIIPTLWLFGVNNV